jgi:hypothetical protein
MSVKFDERPCLILCEGETDKRFLDRLITQREIPNEFQVKFPTRGTDNRGGRSKFGPWLSAAYESADFEQHVRAVLIVSDNDTDPAASLQEVKDSLTKSDGFPIPGAEREVARKDGFPPVAILMIPHGAQGGLETLCVTAAYSKWPDLEQPVEAFMASTPAANWSPGKQSKMKLQSIIATSCSPRPDAGFSGHWWEIDQYHIPLDHDQFDEIADFLRGFRAMVEP